MNEQLAELLLARVMNWQPEDVARERPVLQALAAYKYDEYQQFSPGLRFIESLALWLNDMKDPQHKAEAYKFVRERLVFFSTAEFHHFINIAYPDFIRPQLLRRVAVDAGLNPYHRSKLIATAEFKVHQRSCLFLGLSDGARTDVFRRANDGIITHEQIMQTYEVKTERVDKLLKKLRKDLGDISPGLPDRETARFGTVVLLDDFSGSGTSYLRREQAGELDGKLHEFSRDILDPDRPMAALVDVSNLRVMVVLYIATDQAVNHLQGMLKEIWGPKDIGFEILVVHPLFPGIRIQRGDSLDSLLSKHYDPVIEDEHTKKGGQDVKYGFAGCGLPVILSHNTPNNSIYPLWARTPTLRPLFPRVIRHKKL